MKRFRSICTFRKPTLFVGPAEVELIFVLRVAIVSFCSIFGGFGTQAHIHTHTYIIDSLIIRSWDKLLHARLKVTFTLIFPPRFPKNWPRKQKDQLVASKRGSVALSRPFPPIARPGRRHLMSKIERGIIEIHRKAANSTKS